MLPTACCTTLLQLPSLARGAHQFPHRPHLDTSHPSRGDLRGDADRFVLVGGFNQIEPMTDDECMAYDQSLRNAGQCLTSEALQPVGPNFVSSPYTRHTYFTGDLLQVESITSFHPTRGSGSTRKAVGSEEWRVASLSVIRYQ